MGDEREQACSLEQPEAEASGQDFLLRRDPLTPG